jgi:hypothetical protein
LAVLAVQQIRRMRGGAQGQLMLGADGHVYVVKFQNNPQHMRVLANEFLASRLALAAGLTAPDAELVEVSSWLVENTPELEIDLGRTRVKCQPGLQFGSRFVGGLMPGQLVDFLPEEQLAELKNVGEFAGILALDKWTGNANGRQAVFTRTRRSLSTSVIASTPGSGVLKMRRCAECITATTYTVRSPDGSRSSRG